ncbi:MAG TPA: hypothetical protein VKG02_15760, partial [Blastocatellia bacterium]|nr:hypothetical protein [Blastocatellia bacterium]
MRHSIQLILGCITLAALLVTLINPAPVQNKPGASRRSPQAWILEEALAQLRLYPHDAYLQYVALQLARRENRLDNEVAEQLRRISGDEPIIR